MLLFVNIPLSEPLRASLRQQLPDDIQVIFKIELPESEQFIAFQSAALIMGNPPPAWFTELPPQVVFWQLDSAGFEGYKHLNLTIPVANMGDYFSWPCAETIVAGILGLYRHIHELSILQAQKKWVGAPIRSQLSLLRYKKVVILGSGTIGQSVRKMLSGFDCPVKMLARTDPTAELHSTEELMAELPHTDLVINCLPGAAKGFYTAELFATMQQGSVYANIGRGSTTDEAALIAALQSGQLSGAVLDVTTIEPLPTDSPLWAMPNVILTQHTGGGQLTEDEGKIDWFLSNLARFRNGQAIENQIDLSRGY